MKKTVAVDVDGVLARYDGWKGDDVIGDPIPGAVEFTKKLGEKYEVLIYTTRCTAVPWPGAEYRDPENAVSFLKAWLDKHGFHYDRIWAGQGKPIYVAMVDDRAVSCKPQAWGDDPSYAFKMAARAVDDLVDPPIDRVRAG